MDKNDRKAALERELAMYRQDGNEHRARQVREQLTALEPKKAEKKAEKTAEKKDEVIETTSKAPVTETAAIERTPTRRTATAPKE